MNCEHFENLEPCHPAISHLTEASGLKKQQGVICGHSGCKKRFRTIVKNGKPKTFKQFLAAARQKGFDYDERTERFYCPDHIPNTEEPMQRTASDTAPSEMTREQRRAIFREIDEAYVDEKTGYALDVTDKTIGEKLGVPWAWVKQVREEHFGPAGPDPRVQSLLKKLDDVDGQARRAYDAAMKAAEKADEAEAAAKALRTELVALLKQEVV